MVHVAALRYRTSSVRHGCSLWRKYASPLASARQWLLFSSLLLLILAYPTALPAGFRVCLYTTLATVCRLGGRPQQGRHYYEVRHCHDERDEVTAVIKLLCEPALRWRRQDRAVLFAAVAPSSRRPLLSTCCIASAPWHCFACHTAARPCLSRAVLRSAESAPGELPL